MPGNTDSFKKVEQQVRRAVSQLPRIIGAVAVRFSDDNFRKGGFDGDSFIPWAQRKQAQKGKGRAILIKSGRLRRSVRVLRTGQDHVVIGTDVPYARAHNEGFNGTVTVRSHTRNTYGTERRGTGIYSVGTQKERYRNYKYLSGNRKVRSHTRRMRIPQRRFIGDSPVLRQKAIAAAADHINKAFKI